jgi:hypothetical protein
VLYDAGRSSLLAEIDRVHAARPSSARDLLLGRLQTVFVPVD